MLLESCYVKFQVLTLYNGVYLWHKVGLASTVSVMLRCDFEDDERLCG